MIIDYDFRGKRVTIVGGGHETGRKVRSFVDAGASVRLVGPGFDAEATAVARKLGVTIVRCAPSQVPRRAFESTDVVAVVSDDPSLGRRLRRDATRRRVLFYAGDDPKVSDWVQPAVRFAGPIVVGVSTDGASPIVARTLAERLVRAVRPEDRLEVRLQEYARALARRNISALSGRREALYAIHEDRGVRAALRRGDLGGAKGRATQIVLEAVRRRRGPPRRASRRAP
ncbi:MAG: precorrin-2 dehydrogenase/sirohydrochlorin ferrochelatase family protein [Methanobacteriota archaeon]